MKMVAEREAEGSKKVAETIASTDKLVAAIDKETADLQGQAILVNGAAVSDGKKAVETAKSGRFALAVKAFGNANAFNDWWFATGISDHIDLNFIYAGRGTLWTDMKAAQIIVNPEQGPEPKAK